MQTLIALAAASQMFNPQVDITHQQDDSIKSCIHYDLYEAMARNAGAKMAAHALNPNGTPIQFWIKQDESWGVVLVKEVNGQPVACFYLGGTSWEETDE